MLRLTLCIIATVAAFSLAGPGSPARIAYAAEPFSLSIDCDTGLAGVQAVCAAPSGSTTRTVDIVLRNDSGAASSVGSFSFNVDNASSARLLPPQTPGCSAPARDCNPNFNQSFMTSPNWLCDFPPPTADTGALGAGATQSRINCFTFPFAPGPTLANGASGVLASVQYNIVSAGTTALGLSDAAVSDDGNNELGSCSPVISTTMDCFGASLTTPTLPLVVNSPADTNDGSCTTAANGCTLREAMNAANANADETAIHFNIPPAGNHVILPASNLPDISTRVNIDARTQPGYVGNPLITIDGNDVRTTGLFFATGSGSSTVRGMVVTRFNDLGILLSDGADDVTLDGNYIGVDASGTTEYGNGIAGIHVASDSNVIGGPLGNIISGNGDGIVIFNGSYNGIGNNRIGTDRTGTFAVPNGGGIWIIGASTGNAIGSPVANGGNQISGNTGVGIQNDSTAFFGGEITRNLIGTDWSGTLLLTNGSIAGNAVGITADNVIIGGYPGPPGTACTDECNVIVGADGAGTGSGIGIVADDVEVYGNHIGLDRTGTLLLGNRGHGVFVAGSNNRIGTVSEENTIGGNTLAGIFVQSGTGNDISYNRVFSNGGLGIDLAPAGINVNDAGDGDAGPNNGMNFPVITSVTQGVSTITVNGTLDTAPGFYSLEVYASPSCDGSGNGEGRVRVGNATVSPGAFGVPVSGLVFRGGRTITAVIRDGNSGYDTSEFSNCFTMPACPSDTDCDGYQDPNATLHEGPANTVATVDNCPADWNGYQLNSNGNFIDLTPPKANDDRTWIWSDPVGDACDNDDDGDKTLDTAEAAGCNGSGPLSPVLRDTDLDRFIDSVECTLGTNPKNASSKPLTSACGASVDGDVDGVRDNVEYCFYGSNFGLINSDGDTCNDGREVATVDTNTTVGASDLGLVASAFGSYTAPPAPGAEWKMNMDIDKNGVINAADLGLVASKFGACP